MNFDLFGWEWISAENEYGFHVAMVNWSMEKHRALLSFYWADRSCYLSVLWFTFDWVCLIGWEDGK